MPQAVLVVPGTGAIGGCDMELPVYIVHISVSLATRIPHMHQCDILCSHDTPESCRRHRLPVPYVTVPGRYYRKRDNTRVVPSVPNAGALCDCARG